MEKLTAKLSIGGTKLDDQILFMETANEILTTPITFAILNSLKELRGNKQTQLKELLNAQIEFGKHRGFGNTEEK